MKFLFVMDPTKNTKISVLYRYEGTLSTFQLPPKHKGLEFDVKDIKLTICPSEGVNSPFTAVTTRLVKTEKVERLRLASKPKTPDQDDEDTVDNGLLTSLDNDVYNPMRDTIRGILELIGWRLNTDKPLKKHSVRGRSWSEDGGTTWHRIPFLAQFYFEDGSGLVTIPATLHDDIKTHLPTKQEDPFKLNLVQHELFAEAWSERGERPSSSLLVAICAVEVATKRAIATLCPKASWLTDHAPSPPIVQILEEYLPTLGPFLFNSTSVHFTSAPKGQSRTVLDSLRIGVQLRNKVVHTGAAPPKEETLEEILLACRDAIRLLDFICGETWALEYVRRETLEKLGIAAADCQGICQEKFGKVDSGPH